MTRPLIALLVTASLGHVAHAEDAGGFARELSRLRTDVAALSETLELEREALRADLRSREQRKVELESRIRQEELRLAELERLMARQREILDADSVAHEHLVPVIEASVASLQEVVRRGLPYRIQERTDALGDLADKVREGTLDPRRGVGRLWQAVEDELRLSRENVLDKQVIGLDGGDVLVEVARIGMIALFYRTKDGRFGQAVRTADGWTYQAVTAPEDTERLEELFDALKKQIRSGFFDLPWGLPEVSR